MHSLVASISASLPRVICADLDSCHNNKMLPTYSYQGVLRYYRDYYCLACQVKLETESNVIKHICEESHEAKFADTNYVVAEENIRKINEWYHCEMCNRALKSFASVKLHISEKNHITTKVKLVARRDASGTMCVHDVEIDENSWNGLSEGSCLICDCDYTDENNHLKDATHVVNLFQRKMNVHSKYNIYRTNSTRMRSKDVKNQKK
ncbi:unnamed protein product [Leptidea sinapis]|uniref:C2H2-type domain-containing protein n=1 Tax=Leptidea sinapis TaxID=189913 RepID=A0A5E4QNL1_9NEOP|nr:unnamed protein product [Leptidea sinapis]